MCPKRAFHDQNVLPHSLQGRVIFGAPRSGFLPDLGLVPPVEQLVPAGLSILINLVRFFLGFGYKSKDRKI